jgi:hypothetical protein
MCGLCHSLGDNYGMLARLITNYEMTLLNILTSAQQETEMALPEFAGLQVNPRFYPTNCADCAGQISDSPTKPPLKHEVCIDRLFTPRIPGEPQKSYLFTS